MPDSSEVADQILDGSALAYRSPEGPVVLTGCSHAGICNIIRQARAVCGEERIRDIIGGFHLQDPGGEVMEATCACLPLHVAFRDHRSLIGCPGEGGRFRAASPVLTGNAPPERETLPVRRTLVPLRDGIAIPWNGVWAITGIPDSVTVSSGSASCRLTATSAGNAVLIWVRCALYRIIWAALPFFC